MFPLMHVKASLDIHGALSDELIAGSLLPDVLRLMGCDWGRSHSSALHLARTMGRCHEITIGALLHGENPKGVDFYSDVSFGGVPWGWAFYRAWQFVSGFHLQLPKGLLPWVFHNMVEASVDIYLYEEWDRELVSHIRDIYSWDINWDVVEKLIAESGIILRRHLKGAFADYLELSVARYHSGKCFVLSLYEIARRKFYRHGIIFDIPLDTFMAIWYKVYENRKELYDEYVSVSYDGLRNTYKEWCNGAV